MRYRDGRDECDGCDGCTRRVARLHRGTGRRARHDDADDEFHLHGYDLGGDEIAAGEEAVYRFTASQAGTFGLVSHVTGDLLLTLVVGD